MTKEQNKKVTKKTKVLPVSPKAKFMEASLKDKFRNTASEAKISGNAPQAFNRVRDIVPIPGWGVEVRLHPTKEDPRESRHLSYWQAFDLVKHMESLLSRAELQDTKAVAEMFTAFKIKLLEAVNADPL